MACLNPSSPHASAAPAVAIHALTVADGLCPRIAELLPETRHALLALEREPRPLAAIGQELEQRRRSGAPVAVLQIVAHGQPGAVQLGGIWIERTHLIANADALAAWGLERIELWCCDVAQDRAFVALLEELSGAAVWASHQRLGGQGANRHWELEHPHQASEASPQAPFNKQALEHWPHQLATYTFATAYQVTNTADKETNFHTFEPNQPLGSVAISDGSTVREFSGNDISASAVVIGGTTFFGWVSRPIKVQGQVVGFYFWTDIDFTDLAKAQTDGNADGDGTTADNRGFVLVVAGKDSFFSAGAIGSSSDRVDTALNKLLPPANTAPVAEADVADGTPGSSGGAAVEAGGLNNGSAGQEAFGNVLDNDTDADVGDTKTVSLIGTGSATTAVMAGTTSSTGTLVEGLYGTLQIGADGSYRYVVNNDNASVQALRTSGDTLNDVFTYTMVDGSGAPSTTTLRIVVQGANDNPVAANDYNTAKESLEALEANQYGSNDATGSKATGNVLANDTDVDTGDSKTILGITITGTALGSSAGAGGGVSTLSFNSLPSNVIVGYYVFLDGDNTQNNNSPGTLLLDTNGNQLRITSIDTVNKTFTLSGAIPGGTVNNGQVLGFANNTAGAAYRDAVISGVTSGSGSTINLSAAAGTIAIGMRVGGTGLASDPVITAISYGANGLPASITVDASLPSLTNASLTFTGGAEAGGALIGTYGILELATDGSYIYTPFANSSALSEGQQATEAFSYTMADTAGATSSATLFITVLGSGNNDPNAVADVADGTPGSAGGAAVEAGGCQQWHRRPGCFRQRSQQRHHPPGIACGVRSGHAKRGDIQRSWQHGHGALWKHHSQFQWDIQLQGRQQQPHRSGTEHRCHAQRSVPLRSDQWGA